MLMKEENVQYRKAHRSGSLRFPQGFAPSPGEYCGDFFLRSQIIRRIWARDGMYIARWLVKSLQSLPARFDSADTFIVGESFHRAGVDGRGAYYTAELELNDFLGSKPIAGNINYPLFVRVNRFH